MRRFGFATTAAQAGRLDDTIELTRSYGVTKNQSNLKRTCISILIAAALSLAAAGQSAKDSALISALSARHFAEAVELADASLKSRPADPWLWTVRGIALDGAGDSEASLKSLNKALALNPKYVPALKAASQFSYQHHDVRASEYLKRLLALQPAEPAAHAMAGVLGFEAHNCAVALRHFEQSVQLVVSNEASATEYAQCLLSEHRNADSIAILEQARGMHPESRNLRYDLALAQFDSTRYEDALATLQPAADDDSGILNLRASIETAIGRPDAAFSDLTRAVEMSPLDERNYVDIGLFCLDHYQDQRAADALTVGIAKLPDAASLYAIRGIAYAQLSKYDEAEKDFARASQLDPRSLLGELGHTVVSVEKDQQANAKQSLLLRLEKNPNDPVANTLLADLLMHEDALPGSPEFNQAKSAVKRALQQKPDAVAALNLMGEIEFDESNFDGALLHFEKAHRLEPQNHTTLNHMLLIYRKLGRKEDAAKVADQLKALFAGDTRHGQGTFRAAPGR